MSQIDVVTKGTRVLDEEWVSLIKKAKEMGFSCNEIRTFLEEASDTRNT